MMIGRLLSYWEGSFSGYVKLRVDVDPTDHPLPPQNKTEGTHEKNKRKSTAGRAGL